MISTAKRKKIFEQWILQSPEYKEASDLHTSICNMIQEKAEKVLTDDEREYIRLCPKPEKGIRYQSNVCVDTASKFLCRVLEDKDLISINDKTYIEGYGCGSHIFSNYLHIPNRGYTKIFDDTMILDKLLGFPVQKNTPFLFQIKSDEDVKTYFELYPDFMKDFVDKFKRFTRLIAQLDTKVKRLGKALSHPLGSLRELKANYVELYNLGC